MFQSWRNVSIVNFQASLFGLLRGYIILTKTVSKPSHFSEIKSKCEMPGLFQLRKMKMEIYGIYEKDLEWNLDGKICSVCMKGGLWRHLIKPVIISGNLPEPTREFQPSKSWYKRWRQQANSLESLVGLPCEYLCMEWIKAGLTVWKSSFKGIP